MNAHILNPFIEHMLENLMPYLYEEYKKNASSCQYYVLQDEEILHSIIPAIFDMYATQFLPKQLDDQFDVMNQVEIKIENYLKKLHHNPISYLIARDNILEYTEDKNYDLRSLHVAIMTYAKNNLCPESPFMDNPAEELTLNIKTYVEKASQFYENPANIEELILTNYNTQPFVNMLPFGEKKL